jgi:hypothetical protein
LIILSCYLILLNLILTLKTHPIMANEDILVFENETEESDTSTGTTPGALPTSSTDTNKKEKPKAETDKEPAAGPPRPGDGDVYVFLVGINKYAKAERALTGCVEDINKVEKYLKDRFAITPSEPSAKSTADDPVSDVRIFNIEEEGYKSLKIVRLEDEQATYANVVRGFTEFLAQAGQPDRVWFHFSGHGIETPTALQFQNFTDGKDQCLMCHDKDIDESIGQFDNLLADKELAVLLDRVAQGENGVPHIVVTIDCCNSGGSTRGTVRGEDFEIPDNFLGRQLSTYLNGHYGADDANPDTVISKLPAPPHVVISACNNLQLATEEVGGGGGFFTNGLISVLRNSFQSGNKISYGDLQIQTRAAVTRRNANQTPQIDFLGGARAHARFLEGTAMGAPEHYEVSRKHGEWTIRCGAILGLPTDGDLSPITSARNEPLFIDVYEFGVDDAIGKATINKVGPSYSTITVSEGEEAMATAFNDGTAMYGILSYLPAKPEFVLISGDDEEVDAFFEAWNAFDSIAAKNIFPLRRANTANTPHHLKISIETTHYTLSKVTYKDVQLFDPAGVAVMSINSQNRANKKVAVEEQLPFEYNKNAPINVMGDIIQIINWKRLYELENPTSSLNEKIRLRFNLEGKAGLVSPSNFQLQKGEDFIEIPARASDGIEVSAKGVGSRYYFLLPSVDIVGPTPKLFFYVLYMYDSYLIVNHDQEAPKEAIDEGKIGMIDFGKVQSNNWGLDADENEDLLVCKVIVSEEEFDYHQLLQEGIFQSKGDPVDGLEMHTGFKDWCTLTIPLKLVRV